MTLLNELFDFIIQHKEIIKLIIAIVIILLIVNACYDTWNNMWHDFGKNLYRFFNQK